MKGTIDHGLSQTLLIHEMNSMLTKTRAHGLSFFSPRISEMEKTLKDKHDEEIVALEGKLASLTTSTEVEAREGEADKAPEVRVE